MVFVGLGARGGPGEAATAGGVVHRGGGGRGGNRRRFLRDEWGFGGEGGGDPCPHVLDERRGRDEAYLAAEWAAMAAVAGQA